MTEQYHIVPWFNSEEWHQVYQKIYSSTGSLDSKQEGLNILLVWKARCPSLPSGVESTLTLLQVYLQDVNNDTVNQQLLRLAYSSAIMRFANHMLDTETARGSSFYNAAKNLGVPDWIIDLRHDTAHSNNLPSVELLREACIFGLDWLQKHYWDEHQLFVKDYIVGQNETESNNENKMAALMNFCVSVSICSRNKIKNVADIPDASLRESIVNDIREIFSDQVDLSNLKTVSFSSLLNSLNAPTKRLLQTKDVAAHVNKALLGEDSLLLSMDLYYSVTNSDFYTKNKLQKDYVQYFEVLLSFLHTNDLILDLILELIRISECNENNSHRSKLAGLWVSEILKALKKSKEFTEKMRKVDPEINSKKKKDLRLLFCHWFPNDKHSSLLLDLEKTVPYELTCINFVKPIISAYNPNLTYFIRDLINLVDPNLPKATADKICTLAKLISSPDGFPSSSANIYTVDDLKAESNTNQRNDIDSDSDVICESDSKYYETEQPKNSIWKKASGEHSWSTSPIGMLPWQFKQNTNIAMEMETDDV